VGNSTVSISLQPVQQKLDLCEPRGFWRAFSRTKIRSTPTLSGCKSCPFRVNIWREAQYRDILRNTFDI